MTKTGSFWGMLLLALPLACSGTSSLKLASGPDAGESAANPDGVGMVSEDAKAALPDSAIVADVKPASDTVAVGPEAGKPDSAPPSIDGGGKLDTNAGNKLDTVGPITGPDADLTVRLDAKLPPIDSERNPAADSGTVFTLAGDAGERISGIEVLPVKNFAPVDSACAEGTATWLSTLTTYLAEDRKCWADTDCQSMFISNSCGRVCPVPINAQRIGEFSTYAIGKTDQSCSTCPKLTDMPICAPAPGDGGVACRNNLCVWK